MGTADSKAGDLSLPFKLGTALTSISHPKLMWRDSKAKKTILSSKHFSKTLADFGPRIDCLFCLCGASAESGNLTQRPLPRTHSLLLFFLCSTADGARG